MRIFKKKGCKIVAAPPCYGGWGLHPQTSAFLLSFTDVDLSKFVFSVNLFYYFEK